MTQKDEDKNKILPKSASQIIESGSPCQKRGCDCLVTQAAMVKQKYGKQERLDDIPLCPSQKKLFYEDEARRKKHKKGWEERYNEDSSALSSDHSGDRNQKPTRVIKDSSAALISDKSEVGNQKPTKLVKDLSALSSDNSEVQNKKPTRLVKDSSPLSSDNSEIRSRKRGRLVKKEKTTGWCFRSNKDGKSNLVWDKFTSRPPLKYYFQASKVTGSRVKVKNGRHGTTEIKGKKRPSSHPENSDTSEEYKQIPQKKIGTDVVEKGQLKSSLRKRPQSAKSQSSVSEKDSLEKVYGTDDRKAKDRSLEDFETIPYDEGPPSHFYLNQPKGYDEISYYDKSNQTSETILCCDNPLFPLFDETRFEPYQDPYSYSTDPTLYETKPDFDTGPPNRIPETTFDGYNQTGSKAHPVQNETVSNYRERNPYTELSPEDFEDNFRRHSQTQTDRIWLRSVPNSNARQNFKTPVTNDEIENTEIPVEARTYKNVEYRQPIGVPYNIRTTESSDKIRGKRGRSEVPEDSSNRYDKTRIDTEIPEGGSTMRNVEYRQPIGVPYNIYEKDLSGKTRGKRRRSEVLEESLNRYDESPIDTKIPEGRSTMRNVEYRQPIGVPYYILEEESTEPVPQRRRRPEVLKESLNVYDESPIDTKVPGGGSTMRNVEYRQPTRVPYNIFAKEPTVKIRDKRQRPEVQEYPFNRYDQVPIDTEIPEGGSNMRDVEYRQPIGVPYNILEKESSDKVRGRNRRSEDPEYSLNRYDKTPIDTEIPGGGSTMRNVEYKQPIGVPYNILEEESTEPVRHRHRRSEELEYSSNRYDETPIDTETPGDVSTIRDVEYRERFGVPYNTLEEESAQPVRYRHRHSEVLKDSLNRYDKTSIDTEIPGGESTMRNVEYRQPIDVSYNIHEEESTEPVRHRHRRSEVLEKSLNRYDESPIDTEIPGEGPSMRNVEYRQPTGVPYNILEKESAHPVRRRHRRAEVFEDSFKRHDKTPIDSEIPGEMSTIRDVEYRQPNGVPYNILEKESPRPVRRRHRGAEIFEDSSKRHDKTPIDSEIPGEMSTIRDVEYREPSDVRYNIREKETPKPVRRRHRGAEIFEDSSKRHDKTPIDTEIPGEVSRIRDVEYREPIDVPYNILEKESPEPVRRKRRRLEVLEDPSNRHGKIPTDTEIPVEVSTTRDVEYGQPGQPIGVRNNILEEESAQPVRHRHRHAEVIEDSLNRFDKTPIDTEIPDGNSTMRNVEYRQPIGVPDYNFEKESPEPVRRRRRRLEVPEDSSNRYYKTPIDTEIPGAASTMRNVEYGQPTGVSYNILEEESAQPVRHRHRHLEVLEDSSKRYDETPIDTLYTSRQEGSEKHHVDRKNPSLQTRKLNQSRQVVKKPQPSYHQTTVPRPKELSPAELPLDRNIAHEETWLYTPQPPPRKLPSSSNKYQGNNFSSQQKTQAKSLNMQRNSCEYGSVRKQCSHVKAKQEGTLEKLKPCECCYCHKNKK